MIKRGPHACFGDLPSIDFGPALTACVETADGRLFVGNGEYGSQVAFCPYCGVKAKKPPAVSKATRGSRVSRGAPTSVSWSEELDEPHAY